MKAKEANQLILKLINYQDIKVECGKLIHFKSAAAVVKRIEDLLSSSVTNLADSLEYDNLNWQAENCHFVRGDTKLTDHLNPIEYLQARLISEDDIENIVIQYDLAANLHRRVRQLDLADQKKLELITVLKDCSKPIVLLDPFLALNGRWREHFAGLCLNWAAMSNLPIVALRMGFEPNCWLDSEQVVEVIPQEIVKIVKPAKKNSNKMECAISQNSPDIVDQRLVKKLLAQVTISNLGKLHKLQQLTEQIQSIRSLASIVTIASLTILIAATGIITYNFKFETRLWNVAGNIETVAIDHTTRIKNDAQITELQKLSDNNIDVANLAGKEQPIARGMLKHQKVDYKQLSEFLFSVVLKREIQPVCKL